MPDAKCSDSLACVRRALDGRVKLLRVRLIAWYDLIIVRVGVERILGL
jgi:hypothetical protein